VSHEQEATEKIMAQTLDALFEYLDGLDSRAPLAELTQALASTELDWQQVAQFIQFSPRGYTRNLVRGGPWYNVLVLCWKNGQRSPIHDHSGSSCAVKILRGTATETTFDYAPNGHVWATASRHHKPGTVIGSQDTDLHQISNLQPGNADLVTLHIYSPPLLWMGTYSLTDTARGQEPMFIEFEEAAGI
jgi:cysteine dioxygenase